MLGYIFLQLNAAVSEAILYSFSLFFITFHIFSRKWTRIILTWYLSPSAFEEIWIKFTFVCIFSLLLLFFSNNMVGAYAKGRPTKVLWTTQIKKLARMSGYFPLNENKKDLIMSILSMTREKTHSFGFIQSLVDYCLSWGVFLRKE